MEIKYSSGKLRGKIREVCGTEKEFAKVLKISATALSLKLKVLCQLGGSKNNSKHYEIRN